MIKRLCPPLTILIFIVIPICEVSNILKAFANDESRSSIKDETMSHPAEAEKEARINKLLDMDLSTLPPSEAVKKFTEIFDDKRSEARDRGIRKLEKFKGKSPEQVFAGLFAMKDNTISKLSTRTALTNYLNNEKITQEQADTILNHLLIHPDMSVRISANYLLRNLTTPNLPKYFELAMQNKDPQTRKVLDNSFIYLNTTQADRVSRHLFAKGKSKELEDYANALLNSAVAAKKYQILPVLLKNPESRDLAHYKLRTLKGASFTQAASALLEEEDQGLRKTIAGILEYRNENHASFFSELFSSPSEKVKVQGAILLSEIPEIEGKALYPALSTHTTPEVRHFTQFGHLRRLIKSNSPEAHSEAKEILNNLKDTDVIPVIRELLADTKRMPAPSHGENFFIVNYVAKAKHPSIDEWFKTFISDSNRIVRMESLKALTEVPTERQAQLMTSLLKKLRPEERSYLEISLSQFHSKDPGGDFISQDRLNTMSLVEKEARHQYFEEFSSVLGTLMESKSKEARDLGFAAFGKRTTPEQLEILSKFSPDRQINFFRRQFSEPASQTKAHAANLMGALP
ncbi:MAG: hypothetical protein ABIQ95_11000, partial [Bdellovibrionia bacterium]